MSFCGTNFELIKLYIRLLAYDGVPEKCFRGVVEKSWSFSRRESGKWPRSFVAEKCYRATLVKCPAAFNSRLGEVSLFVRGRMLCLATRASVSSPPSYLASWSVSGLRRFGVIDDRFCFDAGESNGLYLVSSTRVQGCGG